MSENETEPHSKDERNVALINHNTYLRFWLDVTDSVKTSAYKQIFSEEATRFFMLSSVYCISCRGSTLYVVSSSYPYTL